MLYLLELCLSVCRKHANSLVVWVWVFVLYYDRKSVGQSALAWSILLCFTTTCLLLSECCGFVDMGRSLWREDGSVVYNCCWPSPAQSFSGPSPGGLSIIFYCLTFETSGFVVSYDSQGYGGGIRPRLHTGMTWFWNSKLHICYDRRSVG
jgi:hypothetical protein